MAASVVAGTRLGKYEIVKHLATGGMAELLIARSRGLVGFERHVVIKRIREDHDDRVFVDMFLNEASLAALLHHHNIVQVLDIGEEDGKPYFAMEYVHGEDLRRLLHSLFLRKQQMPIEHVVAIISTIAIALHHAHEQCNNDRVPLGIVHRDVTPGNIIIGYDGNVKMLDFGIAKAAMRKVVTQAGMRKGKAPYMSPEQCRGAAIDRRSDIFALGIVLHETITGRRLFKAPNEYATMTAVVEAEIPRPSSLRPEIPPVLDAIVLRALEREPGARFQTAEAMVTELEAFALAQGFRASSLGLAQFMTSVFGTRVEPWLVDDTPPHATHVDFDDTRVDPIAPIEEDSVQAAKKPALPKPRPPAVKPPLPSVLAKPAAVTPVIAVREPVPEPVEEATVVSEIPPIEPLPPPPPSPRPALAAADTTQIVKPLPSPLVTDAPRARRASEAPEPRRVPTEVPVELLATETAPIADGTNRTKILVGAVAAIAGVIVVALVIGFGGGDAATEPPPRTNAAVARPPEIAVQPAPAPPVAAEPEPEPEAVLVEPEPAPVVAEPAPVVAASAPVARPAAVKSKSPAAKRTTKPKAAKPAANWNPNTLFPSK